MHAEPRYSGLLATADEYFAMPDDGFRYELTHGVLVMTPSPSYWHQEVVEMLCRLINGFTVARNLGKAVAAPLDVKVSSATVYQPDIVYFSSAKSARRREVVDVIPDLVVEVASPGTALKDLQMKKADYEAAGIREYWIVDPDEKLFRFFVLRGGRYEEQPSDGYVSEVIKGFRVDAAAFWASLE
ncbi:MAG: Uma2 family endonuclease [Thermodesulfobacteriota bacterium]